MKTYHVLYNPNAGNGTGELQAKELKETLGEIALADMTKIDDYAQFFNGIKSEDEVVVCGGDGTLNRFVNAIDEAAQTHALSYYACGSGNDFMREVQPDGERKIVA